MTMRLIVPVILFKTLIFLLLVPGFLLGVVPVFIISTIEWFTLEMGFWVGLHLTVMTCAP
ncbi:MAG: hypothetical protein KJ606_05485 [Chloroflexi bacterium]|nr:hypothetical protein [Chloroflexota bacterium]